VAYIILPAISVASHPAMIISRLVRTEALTVLGEDYVRTARSKRLTSFRVYLVHVLPNVLTASLTQGGVIAAGMLGGTVIVENVFSWPGLGTAVVEAVLGRDYPLVQGVVLLLGIGVVLVNLVIDVILALTNPQSLIKGA
jgi:peptide/nickel transport system permease protein